MANTESVADRFRQALRAERTRRGLTQQELADAVNNRHNLGIYGSTIAKIERGERSVFLDELSAFSDLFGITADTLLGRGLRGADVMWAASKLSTNAQKMVGDLVRVREQVSDDAQELFRVAERDGKGAQVRVLVDAAVRVCSAVDGARQRLADLSSEWPLPGVSLDR